MQSMIEGDEMWIQSSLADGRWGTQVLGAAREVVVVQAAGVHGILQLREAVLQVAPALRLPQRSFQLAVLRRVQHLQARGTPKVKA